MLYHLCIAHKCLYYKHCTNTISDQAYDALERELCEARAFEMVDFSPSYCRTAAVIDRLPLRRLYELIEVLNQYPTKAQLAVYIDTMHVVEIKS